VQVEATILIDAPLDDVFAILTDYGGAARLRINPRLRGQTVVERSGNVITCENEWESGGKLVRRQRRYRVLPPNRIEEEVIGATSGMLRVLTRLDPEGEQTLLILTSEYELTGIWRFLARFAEGKLREADQSYLATLKDGIEAEFEEVEVEAADDSPE
jgi:Polyketide cyclase / dehydrase and lipid transport